MSDEGDESYTESMDLKTRGVLFWYWVSGRVIIITNISTGIPGLPMPKSRGAQETCKRHLVKHTDILETAAGDCGTTSGQQSPSMKRGSWSEDKWVSFGGAFCSTFEPRNFSYGRLQKSYQLSFSFNKAFLWFLPTSAIWVKKLKSASWLSQVVCESQKKRFTLIKSPNSLPS